MMHAAQPKQKILGFTHIWLSLFEDPESMKMLRVDLNVKHKSLRVSVVQ